MAKYQNKYRIESARAQWWNYGWNGAYFITICTQNQQHYFGKIVNGKMILSQLGIIADIFWHEIPNHAPFVELGDFVVMPNHIHGILILDKPDDDKNVENDAMKNAGNDSGNDSGNDPGNIAGDDAGNDPGNDPGIVQTGHALSLQEIPPPDPPPSHGQKRFQNIGKNTVSSIIGSYKSAVTKHANRLGLPNGWQELFHDHIIRGDAEYRRISNYIINNPKNWGNDKFHSGK